jgi:hypothetical protein
MRHLARPGRFIFFYFYVAPCFLRGQRALTGLCLGALSDPKALAAVRYKIKTLISCFAMCTRMLLGEVNSRLMQISFSFYRS